MHNVSRRVLWLAVVLSLLAAQSVFAFGSTTPARSPASSRPVSAQQPGRLPLSFVPGPSENGAGTGFRADSAGASLAFTPGEVLFRLPGAPKAAPAGKAPARGSAAAAIDRHQPQVHAAVPTVVRLQFEGANRNAELTGGERLPGTANYLLGDDPANWRTNVPTYASILYSQLYPGIDLRYDSNEGQLKGTYLVAPGADPSRIRWRYSGATGVRVDQATGNLHVTAAERAGANLQSPISNLQSLVEHAPVAWQEIAGRRVPVTARYDVAGDGSITFALGRYDTAHELVIDPTITFEAVLGGEGDDYGNDIVRDALGNVYLVGHTSGGLETTEGAFQTEGASDAFVIKLNPDGSVAYSTFLGGEAYDSADGIFVDGEGNAYVAGSTQSEEFPTTPGVVQEDNLSTEDNWNAFVTKLNPQGNGLVYSTYLGGGTKAFGDAIAVDSAGNAIMIGWASLTVGDTPFTDAFVTKLNATATERPWDTASLGGTSLDFGAGIAVDAAGDVWVTGDTWSSDFPVTEGTALQPEYAGGFGDAFVTKLRGADGEVLYSTFLGGEDSDEGTSLAVDPAGSVYVVGTTASTDFVQENPVQAGFGGEGWAGYGDAFVVKLNAAGTDRIYSTYLGGADGEQTYDVTADTLGNAFVTGWTKSEDFPTEAPADGSFGGGNCGTEEDPVPCSDAFIAAIPANGGALTYSTFYGGGGHDEGHGVATDGNGNTFITGETSAPPAPGLAVPALGDNGSDIVVARVLDERAVVATVTPTTAATTTPTATGTTGAASPTATGTTGATTPTATGTTGATTPTVTGTAGVASPTATTGTGATPSPTGTPGAGGNFWLYLPLISRSAGE